MPMDKFEPQKRLAATPNGKEDERNLDEAGYAAEFERLEAHLGSGLKSIIEKPFTSNAPALLQAKEGPSHKRRLSGLGGLASAQAVEAQKEAEKTECIVAVADIAVVISDSHAPDLDSRSIMTADSAFAKNEAET
ncbi:hypothetical protein ACEQ8H_001478, partial [Pleosporales sp. CAS-2024a]